MRGILETHDSTTRGGSSIRSRPVAAPVVEELHAGAHSSFDRTGANADGGSNNRIQPGETRTIGDVTGPGIITHMWFTIATGERYHLKKIVLRMYWDGESSPAVESPIGDFFGLGLGEYFMYESGPLSVGSQKALNCYFPMPFRKPKDHDRTSAMASISRA